jgi:hypothetical protein
MPSTAHSRRSPGWTSSAGSLRGPVGAPSSTGTFPVNTYRLQQHDGCLPLASPGNFLHFTTLRSPRNATLDAASSHRARASRPAEARTPWRAQKHGLLSVMPLAPSSAKRKMPAYTVRGGRHLIVAAMRAHDCMHALGIAIAGHRGC